jgi:hypothetical protein
MNHFIVFHRNELAWSCRSTNQRFANGGTIGRRKTKSTTVVQGEKTYERYDTKVMVYVVCRYERYVMEDRWMAIRCAIGTAQQDDLVVIAGKGAEDFQEYVDPETGEVTRVRPSSGRRFESGRGTWKFAFGSIFLECKGHLELYDSKTGEGGI